MRYDPRHLLTISLLLLTGCHSGRTDRTICAIPQNSSQETSLTERAGMRQKADSLGLHIDWDGPGDSEERRQITLISRATRDQYYGIVVTPTGGATIDAAVQNALRRGIPVVILRDLTSLREQPHLSFVLEDYAAGARLVTSRLQEQYHCKGTVMIVGVDTFSENSVRRLDALENSIRQDCPELRIAPPVVAPFGSGSVQIAAKHALETIPDLVGFIGLNARASLGAEYVIESRKLSRHVAIISFDPSFPLLLRMRRGYVDGVVSQNMRDMGALSVANIAADREGKPYKQTTTLAPMLVTRENIDQATTQDWLQFNLVPPS